MVAIAHSCLVTKVRLCTWHDLQCLAGWGLQRASRKMATGTWMRTANHSREPSLTLLSSCILHHRRGFRSLVVDCSFHKVWTAMPLLPMCLHGHPPCPRSLAPSLHSSCQQVPQAILEVGPLRSLEDGSRQLMKLIQGWRYLLGRVLRGMDLLCSTALCHGMHALES